MEEGRDVTARVWISSSTLFPISAVGVNIKIPRENSRHAVCA
jgi:hypothetical protein